MRAEDRVAVTALMEAKTFELRDTAAKAQAEALAAGRQREALSWAARLRSMDQRIEKFGLQRREILKEIRSCAQRYLPVRFARLVTGLESRKHGASRRRACSLVSVRQAAALARRECFHIAKICSPAKISTAIACAITKAWPNHVGET